MKYEDGIIQNYDRPLDPKKKKTWKVEKEETKKTFTDFENKEVDIGKLSKRNYENMSKG